MPESAKAREKRLARQRAWYEKHKDRSSARSRERYRQNRDEILSQQREYRYTNRDNIVVRQANAHIRRKYGLTASQYTKMAAAQGYVCAICGQTNTRGGKPHRLAVDHDHETDVVRGLLCGQCNSGLGYFKDDLGTLRAAVAYLAQHTGKEDGCCTRSRASMVAVRPRRLSC